ncbi:LAMI_0D00738g1_1 [Lachancea mirantina]|uniref:LAMI_0D00738g1_1 n=1 Tax=Lachancea mirantina TaxID=1230905 RepID=A0A1G4J8C2_9SACH|nr:LAMI_0D00738g1_1 [Lachancea mirantina]
MGSNNVLNRDNVEPLSLNISIPSQQQQRRQSMILLSESVASRRSSMLSGQQYGRTGRKSGVGIATGPQSPHMARSVDSRVMIDVGSPNFKTREHQQEEIINSLRNNYLNEHPNSKQSRGSSPNNLAPEGSSSQSDRDSLFPEHDHNLETPGGDITRDIYKLSSSRSGPHSFKKNKSLDDLEEFSKTQRSGSTASALNVPGGFRREFIVQKLRSDTMRENESSPTPEAGSRPSGPSDAGDLTHVPFLTRNFLEFLYVYGHFAGESFDEDFYTGVDAAGQEMAEEDSPLLRNEDLEGGKRILTPKSARASISTTKAFLLLIKSFIGTGILFLPSAFANGGLCFSVIMLTFFGAYSYWCYYILAKSKTITKVTSFGDIGSKLYGPVMKFVILFSLVLTQLGFSGAYVVFTAKNLLAFIENVFKYRGITIVHLLILQLIIFIPLSFIRNISKLSFPSLLANFFVMVGICIVAFFIVKHISIDLAFTPVEGIIMGFNSKKWTLFIGTAIFAFEGIGLIIPVQDSMKNPEKFPKVLACVIVTATVLFVTIGSLGYLSYGPETQTVILLNLPQNSIFVNLVQFFYSLAILLSTPLQLFPAIAIIESKVFPKFTKIYNSTSNLSSPGVQYHRNSGKLNWRIKWLKNGVRSLIVASVVAAAYFGVDNLDKFVSIVGSFACIPLVYIYPPMLHLESCSKPRCNASTSVFSRWPIYLDYALIVFGLIGMMYTSYQSLFS